MVFLDFLLFRLRLRRDFRLPPELGGGGRGGEGGREGGGGIGSSFIFDAITTFVSGFSYK